MGKDFLGIIKRYGPTGPWKRRKNKRGGRVWYFKFFVVLCVYVRPYSDPQFKVCEFELLLLLIWIPRKHTICLDKVHNRPENKRSFV